MSHYVVRALLGTVALTVCQPLSAADGLCGPLREFLKSVGPHETRIIKFHTVWGSNFNDDKEEALGAKRCEHYDYGPAKTFCAYLMDHSAIEFSGNNAKAVLACLAPGARFPPHSLLHAISLSMSYGTKDRGSNVEVSYLEDDELGGMVLTIAADGY